MDKYNQIALYLLLLVLSSCAQVGEISGGSKDVKAPLPIAEKTYPPDQSVRFSGNQVAFTFDEFIKLENPTENIVLIPPHATINATVKKKTLTLRWSEDLEPNTTYTLYLNGAVKDISAGNDSILQYVFSTGDFLDSLRYETVVRDAETDKPLSDITLLLHDEDGKLISFAQTDQRGNGVLRNLKSGVYSVLAVEDANKNLRADASERIGFPETSDFHLTQHRMDSTGVRLYRPSPPAGITSLKFTPPALLSVGLSESFSNKTVHLNNSPVAENRIKVIREDSLQLFLGDSISGSIEVVVAGEQFTDTSTLRIVRQPNAFIGRAQEISKSVKGSALAPSEPLKFVTHDLIKAIDSEKITIIQVTDSSLVPFEVNYTQNEFELTVDRSRLNSISVQIDSGAVIMEHAVNTLYRETITLESSEKYGVLRLDLSSYSAPLIVRVLVSGKPYRTLTVNDPKEPLVVTELRPAEYTFSIVLDANRNRKWDVGELATQRQPEIIHHYSKPVKVRPNWEVEVPLLQKSSGNE